MWKIIFQNVTFGVIELPEINIDKNDYLPSICKRKIENDGVRTILEEEEKKGATLCHFLSQNP